jgi:hypothetical protein
LGIHGNRSFGNDSSIYEIPMFYGESLEQWHDSSGDGVAIYEVPVAKCNQKYSTKWQVVFRQPVVFMCFYLY